MCQQFFKPFITFMNKCKQSSKYVGLFVHIADFACNTYVWLTITSVWPIVCLSDQANDVMFPIDIVVKMLFVELGLGLGLD